MVRFSILFNPHLNLHASVQANAKLMDERQQLVMTALGAVLSLFLKHHLQAVRNIVRSRTLLEFFVCPFRRSHSHLPVFPVLPKVWVPNSTPDSANWVDLDLLKQFTWGLHGWIKREYVAMTECRIMALIHYLTHGRPFLHGFIAYAEHINSTMRRQGIQPCQVAHLPSSEKAFAKEQRKALRKTVMSHRAISFRLDSRFLRECVGKRFFSVNECSYVCSLHSRMFSHDNSQQSRLTDLILPQMYLLLRASGQSIWRKRRLI